MSSQTVTVSQYLEQISTAGAYSSSVTLSDTGSNIASLSASDSPILPPMG
ncbi:hypothetical protein [Novosphingobium nitrogenifigens]|nr:hypothetical protein [Novosphingobium nitrogenifigens]